MTRDANKARLEAVKAKREMDRIRREEEAEKAAEE